MLSPCSTGYPCLLRYIVLAAIPVHVPFPTISRISAYDAAKYHRSLLLQRHQPMETNKTSAPGPPMSRNATATRTRHLRLSMSERSWLFLAHGRRCGDRRAPPVSPCPKSSRTDDEPSDPTVSARLPPSPSSIAYLSAAPIANTFD